MRRLSFMLIVLFQAAGCVSVGGPILGDNDAYIKYDSPTPLHAENASCRAVPEGPLSINEAVQIALSNNIDIRIAQRNIEIADDRIDQARGAFLPKIAGIAKQQRKDRLPAYEVMGQKMSLGSKDTGLYNLSVIVPIYDFGRSSARYGQALLSRELEKAKTAEIRQEIIFTVKDSFLQLLKLEKIHEVILKSIEQLKEHEKNTQEFLKNGLVDKTALLSIQVKIAEIEQEKVKIENGLRLTRSALNQILNVALDFDTQIEDLPEVDFKEFDEEDCIRLAFDSRPEVLEVKRQHDLASASLSAAKAERYPKLTAIGSYNYQDDVSLATKEFWQAELTLEVPLWSGGITSAGIREAKKAIKQVEDGQERLFQAIHLQVKSACSSIVEANQSILTAKKGVASAEENLRILTNKYNKQLVTATDLLDGEIALATAKSRYVQAVYGYLQALAALERAVGREASELPTVELIEPKEKSDEKNK